VLTQSRNNSSTARPSSYEFGASRFTHLVGGASRQRR
jgi:hypothetical protein